MCRIQHPYQYELDHFEPTPEQLQLVESTSVQPLDDTPLTLVDNMEVLEKLSKELKSLKEFAVDLEVSKNKCTLNKFRFLERT